MDAHIITLKAHNNQEAFDMAARHLATMNGRAMDGSACVYESESGKAHCVVGALLDLDTPAKKNWARKVRAGIKNLLSGEDWRTPSDGSPAFSVYNNGVDPNLLHELQISHDESTYWSATGEFNGWGSLRFIATTFELNTKALDALGV